MQDNRTRIAPAAKMIAAWIAGPAEVADRRRRFRRVRLESQAPEGAVELLMEASGELLMEASASGQIPALEADTLEALMADAGDVVGDLEGWQWRALLWWEMLVELRRLDISLGLSPGEEGAEGAASAEEDGESAYT